MTCSPRCNWSTATAVMDAINVKWGRLLGRLGEVPAGPNLGAPGAEEPKLG